VTCGRFVVFSWYSGSLHQLTWPPLYSWTIVESDVKHHKQTNLKDVYDSDSIHAGILIHIVIKWKTKVSYYTAGAVPKSKRKKSISVTHKYMILHFSGLVQTSAKSGGVKLVLRTWAFHLSQMIRYVNDLLKLEYLIYKINRKMCRYCKLCQCHVFTFLLRCMTSNHCITDENILYIYFTGIL
jgi:hypothetical protein